LSRQGCSRAVRVHEVDGRGRPRHATQHPLGHRSRRRARRHVGRACSRQDDDSEGQHLVALSVSRREHHAVAARRHHSGARAARLHRSGLRPEQDRRHQRVQGRRPEPLPADLQAVRDPCPLQLQGRGHDVGALPAEGADARPRSHLPGRHPHSRLFLRQEHRPSADDQVPHLHDDDRRNEERVGTIRTRGFTRRSSICWPSRKKSTRDSSRSWTARPPATGPVRGRCIRW